MEAEAFQDGAEGAPEEGRTEVLPVRYGEGHAVDRSAAPGLLKPIARPEEVVAAQEETRDLVAKALKSGRDWDTIQGTNRPTLLKPGAERINAAFGAAAVFTVIEKEVDHDRPVEWVKRKWEWHPEIRGKKVWTEEHGTSVGLYRYVILCDLIHRASGVVIGSGVGSCSTMESKYIDRPREVENTILKMAKKRSYIDATLTTFGLSEQFTQDVEDMDGFGGPSNAPEWSLDAPALGKQYKGKTWREVCEIAPDYVAWAIGRKPSFAGMDNLNADQRQALSDELDRLATIDDDPPDPPNPTDCGADFKGGEAEGLPPSGDEHAEAYLETLRTGSPETGKHAGKSWLRIHTDDPEYLLKALSQGWGKRYREDVDLFPALQWAVGGRLERAKLTVTPEPRPPEGDDELASATFVRMVNHPDVTVAGLDAFAVVHPDLPDDLNEWEEADYQTAVNAFRSVEDRGGAVYAIQRALDRLKARQAPSAPDSGGGSETITADKMKQADSALAKAESVGLDCSFWRANLSQAIANDDAEAYAELIDEIRNAYFRKAARKAP